ncbi:hypothetical protein PFISCL1PPCAC_24700, partial [Pristionchus fissidentatus]
QHSIACVEQLSEKFNGDVSQSEKRKFKRRSSNLSNPIADSVKEPVVKLTRFNGPLRLKEKPSKEEESPLEKPSNISTSPSKPVYSLPSSSSPPPPVFRPCMARYLWKKWLKEKEESKNSELKDGK